MLTSFFGKSKPVNYVFVAALMTIFFVGHHIMNPKSIKPLSEIAFQAGMLLVFILTMLLADFISRKNKLTNINTFVILVFGVFLTVFPATFLNTQALISHLFILLALRRLISLRTQKDIQKKIFDAALWISLASCFYFWSFLFIIFLFGCVIVFAGRNFKNYVIPFVGMAAVIILCNVYTLLIQNAFYTPIDWVGNFDFDFTFYNQFKMLLPTSILLTILLWLTGYFLFKYNVKSKKQKSNVTQLFSLIIIALTLVIVTPQKNGSEIVFLALPFSILTTNYLESKGEKSFKELLLWLWLLLPAVILLIS